MGAARDFLRSRGFVELRAPVIEPFTDPGLRGAKFFEVDFYGRPYKLMSALTVHKPLLATSLGKVFSICPCLRAEEEDSAGTGRHLAEFYQIEVELPSEGYEKAMREAELLVQHVIAWVVEGCKDDLALLGRELDVPSVPFRRLTHREAVDMAVGMGLDAGYGKELAWDVEKAISERLGSLFFITHYPLGSRGFYDKDGDTHLLDFDLMYPGGFGEASSGGEREFEYHKVKKKLDVLGISEEYRDYLELLKRGRIKPSSGFGIGLERLTRYICGLDHIAEAAPFAKLPGGGPW